MTVTYTGRIDAATDTSTPTATVTFDVRLRTDNRTTGHAARARFTSATRPRSRRPTWSTSLATPDTADAYRQADIDLVDQGIDVTAGKSFNPTSITEPSHGPVKVTLSQPPARRTLPVADGEDGARRHVAAPSSTRTTSRRSSRSPGSTR